MKQTESTQYYFECTYYNRNSATHRRTLELLFGSSSFSRSAKYIADDYLTQRLGLPFDCTASMIMKWQEDRGGVCIAFHWKNIGGKAANLIANLIAPWFGQSNNEKKGARRSESVGNEAQEEIRSRHAIFFSCCTINTGRERWSLDHRNKIYARMT